MDALNITLKLRKAQREADDRPDMGALLDVLEAAVRKDTLPGPTFEATRANHDAVIRARCAIMMAYHRDLNHQEASV